MKLRIIFEVIRSKQFAFLTLTKLDKNTGRVEGYFSKKFTERSKDNILLSAELSFKETYTSDKYKSIINEANIIINE